MSGSVSSFFLTVASLPGAVASRLNPYRHLESRITLLGQGALVEGQLTDQQKNDLRYAFKLAHSWSWPAGRMQRLLANVPPQTIRAFITEIIAAGNDKDMNYYLQRCFSFLTENNLLELAGLEDLENARSVFTKEAETKETILENDLNPKFKALIKWFSYESKAFFHRFMGILVTLTGVETLSRDPNDNNNNSIRDWEAQENIKNYWKLLGTPAIIFAMFYSKIKTKAPSVALTAFSIVAILTSIVAYQRLYKPCPLTAPGFSNLSSNPHVNDQINFPRRDILREIEKAFQKKKSVILVGEPGSGKTWIVRSFAEQATQGKICSNISNLQVFSRNASDLVNGVVSNFPGDSNASLDTLSARFAQHRNQVVFFLDEFHAPFKSDEHNGGVVVDKIKTFCTANRVIGATTTAEYNAHIKDQEAITGRRFKIIHVGALDHEQLEITLSQHLNRVNSKIIHNPGVMDYIINMASAFNGQTSPLDAAKSLMDYAISKMTSYRFNELEDEIDTLRETIDLTRRKLAAQGNGKKHKTTREKLISLLKTSQTTLAGKEEQLARQNTRVKKLQKMEAYHFRLKEQSHRLAIPDADLGRKWEELQAQIQCVANFIADERTALGLPVSLNKKLIDQILAEENTFAGSSGIPTSSSK